MDLSGLPDLLIISNSFEMTNDVTRKQKTLAVGLMMVFVQSIVENRN